MDSLIDDAEDVKELGLAGVFQNLLELMSWHIARNIFKSRVERHYRNKWKTWLAEAHNTYFNTPWSLIAFLAVLLALVPTFIQTWYTTYPNN